jgi:dihydropyrimidinase
MLIRGGTAVTPDGRCAADIRIENGRIAAIESRGSVPTQVVDRVVDADGLLVLPGVVDVHTHTRIPDEAEPDRFFRESIAAAFGGTTTFLAFNNPGTGLSTSAQRTLRGGVEEWLSRTSGESAIDFGLSAVVTARQEAPESDLAWAIAQGVATLKAFMVYDFGLPPTRLRSLLRDVTAAGGMLELHCEDPARLQAAVSGLLASGRTRPADHAASRPVTVEARGTARAVAWALEAGAPLYVVHLSCEEALKAVRQGRHAGARILVETCPHFLALDVSRYGGSDQEAARFVVSPPLRAPGQPQALWRGIADGTIDVVATDHVPDRLAVEKRYVGQPFTQISNGAPGIETLLTLVYSEGVAKDRISLERMVEVLSAAPARLFGLPSKGAIEIGRDADLVLFDPAASRTIRQADLHHTSDYTPFEGLPVSGAVHRVVVRGEDIVRDGAFVGRRGYGRYQERSLA